MPSIPAIRGYLMLSGGQGLATGLIWTQYLLFQDDVVGIAAFMMPLLGTISEITITLCEVPTGIVADTISRRLSTTLGLLVFGMAFLIQAAFPIFPVVVAGAVLWGLAETFISGAREAWIADEIAHSERPDATAGQVFTQGNVTRLLGMVVGAWGSALLGQIDLRVTIAAGAVIFLLLAAMCQFALPEKGFHRAAERERTTWKNLAQTAKNGFRIARSSVALWSIMLAVFFTGLASEGFDRLYAVQIDNVLGLPDQFDKPIWFAILASVPALIAAGASTWIARSSLVRVGHHTIWALTAIHFTLMLAVLGFALAGSFWIGAACLMVGRVLRRIDTPLIQAWTSDQATSDVRATVLSFQSQAHGLGEIGGGPFAATVAAWHGVRAALAASGGLVVFTVLTLGQAAMREQKSATSPPETE